MWLGNPTFNNFLVSKKTFEHYLMSKKNADGAQIAVFLLCDELVE